jgi:hypothetical protein
VAAVTRARLAAVLALTLLTASAATTLTGCSGEPSTSATTTTTAVPETTTTTEAPLSAGKQFSFYVPAVGDCFDVRTAPKAPTIYLKLDCNLPHENEVFAVVELTGTDYPGAPFLEAAAKKACPASWEAYVGQAYETSSLAIGYLIPDEATWGNGIRHVTGCLVRSGDDSRRAGSAKGSGL